MISVLVFWLIQKVFIFTNTLQSLCNQHPDLFPIICKWCWTIKMRWLKRFLCNQPFVSFHPFDKVVIWSISFTWIYLGFSSLGLLQTTINLLVVIVNLTYGNLQKHFSILNITRGKFVNAQWNKADLLWFVYLFICSCAGASQWFICDKWAVRVLSGNWPCGGLSDNVFKNWTWNFTLSCKQQVPISSRVLLQITSTCFYLCILSTILSASILNFCIWFWITDGYRWWQLVSNYASAMFDICII